MPLYCKYTRSLTVHNVAPLHLGLADDISAPALAKREPQGGGEGGGPSVSKSTMREIPSTQAVGVLCDHILYSVAAASALGRGSEYVPWTEELALLQHFRVKDREQQDATLELLEQVDGDALKRLQQEVQLLEQENLAQDIFLLAKERKQEQVLVRTRSAIQAARNLQQTAATSRFLDTWSNLQGVVREIRENGAHGAGSRGSFPPPSRPNGPLAPAKRDAQPKVTAARGSGGVRLRR